VELCPFVHGLACISNVAPAEFGRAGGAAISASLKSGTNAFPHRTLGSLTDSWALITMRRCSSPTASLD
jgi:hypothetical protein